MSGKPHLELPPQVAKAFARDMRAFLSRLARKAVAVRLLGGSRGVRAFALGVQLNFGSVQNPVGASVHP